MKKIFLILLLNFSFCFSLDPHISDGNYFTTLRNAKAGFYDYEQIDFSDVAFYPPDKYFFIGKTATKTDYCADRTNHISAAPFSKEKSKEFSFYGIQTSFVNTDEYAKNEVSKLSNMFKQDYYYISNDRFWFVEKNSGITTSVGGVGNTKFNKYRLDFTMLRYNFETCIDCDKSLGEYPNLATSKCDKNCVNLPSKQFRFDCMCNKQGLGDFVSFHSLRKSTYSNSKDCIKEVNGTIVDNCTMTITDATYNSKDGKTYKSGEFDCAIECSNASFGISATSDDNSVCFDDTIIVKKDDNSTATVGDDSGNGGNNNNNKPDNPNPSNPDTPNTPGNNNDKDKDGTTNNKGDININNNQDITGDTNSTTINNNNNVNNNGGNGKDGDSKIYDLLNNFDFKGNFENGKKSFDKDNEESIKKIDEMREKGNSFLDDSKSNFDEAKKSVNDLINSVKNPINSVKSHGSCKTCLYSKTFEFYRGYSTNIEFDFCEFICRINTATYLFFYGVLTFLFIKLFFNIILRLF